MSHTPDANPIPSKGQAGADPYSIPLAKIDVSDAELFETDTHWGYFERLRKEDPVHYCAAERLRPLLVGHALRRHRPRGEEPGDLLVGAQHRGGRSGPELPAGGRLHHDGRRQARRPPQGGAAGRRRRATSRVLEPLIRERVARSSTGCRSARRFDWVDRVSIELTTGMLATLFDFPVRAAPQAHVLVGHGDGEPAAGRRSGVTEDERRAALMECLAVFTELWKERESTAADRASRLHHGARERARRRAASTRGVPRDPDPADRRRQRHDAELDLGRRRSR